MFGFQQKKRTTPLFLNKSGAKVQKKNHRPKACPAGQKKLFAHHDNASESIPLARTKLIFYAKTSYSSMKKILFIFLFAFACVFAAQAQQNYKSAIGLRLGYPLSVSYKTFISEPGAIEVFAGFRSWSYYSWFNVGGLYQHHFAIPSVQGLDWYVGGGASAYFWNFKDQFVGDNGTSTTFGILGNIGLDYKFANAPVNISVDWMPAFFVNGYGNGFGGGYGGLAVRYTLN